MKAILPLILFSLAALLISSCKQSASSSSTTAATQSLLVPDFSTTGINRIQIQSQFRELNIERKGELWTVREFQNYPASAYSIASLLERIRRISIIEKIPTTPESLADFGLVDPATLGGKKMTELSEDYGIWLHLHSDSSETFSILVGTLQSSDSEESMHFGDDYDGHRYARMPGSNDVLSLDDTLQGVNTISSTWIEQSFFQESPARTISYTENGTTHWSLTRPKRESPFVLSHQNTQTPLPTLTRKLDYNTSSFQVDTPLAPATADILSSDFPAYFQIETLSGHHYRLHLGPNAAVHPEEKAYILNARGFLVPSLPSAKTTVALTPVPGKPAPTAIQQKPGIPWINHQYLFIISDLNKLRLTREELLVYEDMLKQ